MERIMVLLLLLLFFAAVDVVDARNFKKGVAMNKAQSCGALERHGGISWWYSWSTHDGYTSGFCDDPDRAANKARRSGIEFVPMFWGSNSLSSSSNYLDDETIANLDAASYVIGFNEPERSDQANIDAYTAAGLWPTLVDIAQEYNLQIVGPCMTDGGDGPDWYSQWTSACIEYYGEPCQTDFTCIHTYYHPIPCDSTVEDWACVQDGAAKIIERVEYWYDTYGKPIWITEFACPTWGWDSGTTCSESEQSAFMKQVVPVLDNKPEVFRYAWHTVYDSNWLTNSLNKMVWTEKDDMAGYGCVNKKWLFGTGNNDGSQPINLSQCVAAAKSDSDCYSPLILPVDDDNCYCSTDNCSNMEYNHAWMTTYFLSSSDDTSALTPLGRQYNSMRGGMMMSMNATTFQRFFLATVIIVLLVLFLRRIRESRQSSSSSSYGTSSDMWYYEMR